MSRISTIDKIEIPKNEYAVLKTLAKAYKKNAPLFRVLEAEENLRKGKVKALSFESFLNDLKK